MSKKIIKVLVLVLVFLGTLTGLSLLTGKDQVNLMDEMPSASLPVVYLKKEDVTVNELFGYRGDMDATSIRNTITPLSEDRVLPVTIQTFQNHVEEISYEVRTMDMERLLERTQVSGYSETDGKISTELQIQNLLEKDCEYRLILILECGGEEIRYYTRIISTEECYVDESIGFVLEFHEKTFDKSKAEALATYLEPNSEGDNTTLQKVTIHSSLNQVAWADFEGEVLKDPVPSIQEINSFYNSIVLNYIMASSGENGETEFYNVTEYYRVRYSQVSKRMHLLDYERTMNEIFRGSGDHFSGTSLVLGIRDTDISYLTNEEAATIGFVQEGDLWSYNRNTNQLSLVFSFRGMEGFDDRENNFDHEIRMIKMDEHGNMDFVVYGYMNRGDHEGCTGVALYHYDCAANTVQERLFVESDDSYQILKENWGSIFYVNDKEYFYMMADGSFYRIPLTDKSAEQIYTGLTDQSFAVSSDGRYTAWREAEKENCITVTDLEDEKQWQVRGAADDVLQPIGFIESDFVYGLMRPGETGDLMYRIVIVDQNRQVIKEYEKSGYYISDACVKDDAVFLERIWKNENTYTQIDDDTIKSHEIEAGRDIQIETVVTDKKQTQVKLTVKKELPKKTPQILTPKEIVTEEKNTIRLDSQQEAGYYYVYVGGNIILSTCNAADAVQAADERAGIVLEDNLWYIWKRGTKASVSLKEEVTDELSAALRAGKAPEAILAETKPEAEIIKLTGCSLSQVLYYLSEGNLVFVRDETGRWIVITGYDERNITLYDPSAEEYDRWDLKDSEALFETAGNIFVSCIQK